MKKVFLDTETTGLAPGQIAQLSMIILEEDGTLRTKNYFFKVDFMTKGAVEVCGRDTDFYAKASNGKVFADYKDEIFEELQHSTIIAHNSKFDVNFISTEFWRENMVFTPEQEFDTMNYFRDIVKIPYVDGKGRSKKVRGSEYKQPKLIELVEYFNINKDKIKSYSEKMFNYTEETGFHDSRYDTTAMFIAFQIYWDSLYNRTGWKEAFV